MYSSFSDDLLTNKIVLTGIIKFALKNKHNWFDYSFEREVVELTGAAA